MNISRMNDDGGWDEYGRWVDHEHYYDDATGEPCVCPVRGCWFNTETTKDQKGLS